ncbi:MAG: hypothetical protein J0I84_08920 [Terrimonas sp.]|nr:hypothetical protein [Terrimonas sp.]OJY88693.1 MAG: hypothetical protein BGP13_17470 [Sphingobacteriales bacterium 40-81]
MPDLTTLRLTFPEGITLIPINLVSTPVWNRLEASPVGDDMTRSLRAEIRDPLWMLSRQWQFGEFEGDDAGTPVFTNLEYYSGNVSRNTPLETIIESQPLFPLAEPKWKTLYLRIQMGCYWFELLNNAGATNLREIFISGYPLTDDFPVNASQEDRQYFQLYANRCIDGYDLLADELKIVKAKIHVDQHAGIEELLRRFKNWYEATYYQNPKKDNWDSSHLEYQYDTTCKLAKPDGSVYENKLLAKEYHHGHLDWYNFEVASVNTIDNSLSPVELKIFDSNKDEKKLIPSPASFGGMPQARYWAFEDGLTNFSSVSPETTDICKMALLEFSLIYSNDWFIIPMQIAAGSIAKVKKLAITDSFGVITNINALANTNTENWDHWGFFTIDATKSGKADDAIFIPATAINSLNGEPLEEIYFIRDEMANLVWAIETIVPSAQGKGISGKESAATDKPAAKGEKLYYQKKTTIPANWIPFVPVKNKAGKLVFRRGITFTDNSGKKIRPLTGLLRTGLNADDTVISSSNFYDINEAEISRAGLKLTKAFQRTRWTNGEVYLWLANQKQTGRGEGNSGLAFDQLVNK